MPPLIWTPSALIDVQRLHRFLAPKDVNAAQCAAHAIRAGMKILPHQPSTGQPVADINPEFREWLIDFGSSRHVALHRFDVQTVAILAVRHQTEAGCQLGQRHTARAPLT
jgi:plasmid stabilization system protein ParE